jgi:sensor histidine kinase YesM
MTFTQKYQLKLGIWVCLFWGIYSTLRNMTTIGVTSHVLFLLISFALLYISMMAIWLIIFHFLHPIIHEDSFYETKDILRIFLYCLCIIIPFLGIGYYVEVTFTNDKQATDSSLFIQTYALRIMFEFVMVMTFKYLTDGLDVARTYSEQTYKLQEANTKAQFNILKQQVNPHFLFNALSTLKSLIRLQDPNADEFVMSLSDVYRKLLQERDKDLIRLSDELGIVNSYLFMQKLRFENNLIVENTISVEAQTLFIPPFALQILIENTIKHNIISQRRPLSIRLFIRDNKVVVENDIQPRKIPEESTGWGLSSLAERYTTFTDVPIDISKTDTTFSVGLPLLMQG